MLPAQARLRDRKLLASTVKRGTRAGRRYVVIHFLPSGEAASSSTEGPRVAFAVSKSVGGSVTRHRVVRRLRQVIVDHLAELPAGSTVVVRALPAAATASSADLSRDVEALLPRVTGVCA